MKLNWVRDKKGRFTHHKRGKYPKELCERISKSSIGKKNYPKEAYKKMVKTRKERGNYIAWNKGLNKFTNPSIMSNSIKNRKLRQGKTYEELFDSERAKKLKKKRSIWFSIHNPMYNEKTKKKIIKDLLNSKKPNKSEQFLINLINQNILSFDYVGDGKIWFKNEKHMFNPDFINEDKKQIIEFFGDYWHNRPDSIERDEERIKTYKNHGYNAVVIWQHELKKSPIEVINKINSFSKEV